VSAPSARGAPRPGGAGATAAAAPGWRVRALGKEGELRTLAAHARPAAEPFAPSPRLAGDFGFDPLNLVSPPPAPRRPGPGAAALEKRENRAARVPAASAPADTPLLPLPPPRRARTPRRSAGTCSLSWCTAAPR
jgi:hypothetical protein